MGEVKQINIKNRTYYFYNDQINWKDFDASMLKIDQKITKRLTFITSVMWLLNKLLIATILTRKSFVLNEEWSDWSLSRKMWK